MSMLSVFTLISVLSLCLTTVSAAGCPFHSSSSKSTDQAGPSPAPTLAPSLPGSTNLTDPFVRMNNVFHTQYDSAGVAMRPDVIIFQENDYLVLMRGANQRDVLPGLTMKYHNLKMVCHLVLGLYMMLLEVTFASPPSQLVELPTNLQSAVRNLQSLAVESHADLVANPSRFDAGPQLERQFKLFNMSMEFMDVLEESKWWVTGAQVTAFTRGAEALLAANLDEAASDQVNTSFKALETWKAMLTTEEWASVRVVLTTSHMAQRGALMTQLVARYFDQPDMVQSDRFISMAHVTTEEYGLTSLDKHMTDYAMGDSFFNSHFRMHEDALCAGAKKALDKLFPESANNTAIGCPNPGPNPL